MRFDNAVTYFLEQWPTEGPSPDTVRTYTGQLHWFVAFAARQGRLTLAEALEPNFLRAAMAEKMAVQASHPSSHKGGQAAANSLGSAARALARWLLAQGVPVPDVSAVKLPKVPERVQPRLRDGEFPALEAAVLRHLVDGGSPILVARDLAMLWLLGDTGLRAQELCGMTVDSIDWQSGSIMIHRGKGNRGRALCIIDPDESDGGRTLRLLGEWIDARATMKAAATHPMLWVSFRGTPLNANSVRSILHSLCIQAGIPGNRPPHTFRRAVFTSHYRRDPREIDLLSSRMGWSDQSRYMAQIYTRGAEVDFARTIPVPSLSAQWHSRGVDIQGPYAVPMARADSETSYTDRPRPAFPAKSRQVRGRLPGSLPSRRLRA